MMCWGAERCGHGLGPVETLSVRSMYKIDRRGGGLGGGSKNRSLGIYLGVWLEGVGR